MRLTVDSDELGDPVRIVQYTLLALAAWLLVARTTRGERRGALLAGALALGVAFLPLGLELFDKHYLLHRNAIAAAPLIALIVATGFGARRAGWPGLLGAGAFATLSVVLLGWAAVDYGRNGVDWRATGEAVGRPAEERAVILTDPDRPARLVGVTPPGPTTLSLYLSEAKPLTGRSAPLREIVVVDEQSGLPAPGSPLPGFAPVERRPVNRFVVTRYRASSPVPVGPRDLSPRRLGRGLSHVWVQRPAVPGGG